MALELDQLVRGRAIGRGLTCSAVLCAQRETRERFVLKVIEKATLSRNGLDNIYREKEHLSTLTHAGIVRFHRTLKDDACLYFLLEHLDGGTLLWHLRRAAGGRLAEEAARRVVGGVLLPLRYMLEEAGVLYRDLKPTNIMFTAAGRLKLIDFGHAKKIEAGERSTSVCGTPHYHAPETVRGEPHGAAAQLWALGVLLFEVLNGTPPFWERDAATAPSGLTLAAAAAAAAPLRTRSSPHRPRSSGCPRRAAARRRAAHGRRGRPRRRLPRRLRGVAEHAWFGGLDWEALGAGAASPSSTLPRRRRRGPTTGSNFPTTTEPPREEGRSTTFEALQFYVSQRVARLHTSLARAALPTPRAGLSSRRVVSHSHLGQRRSHTLRSVLSRNSPLRFAHAQLTSTAAKRAKFPRMADATEKLSADKSHIPTSDDIVAAARFSGYGTPDAEEVDLVRMKVVECARTLRAAFDSTARLPTLWPESPVRGVVQLCQVWRFAGLVGLDAFSPLPELSQLFVPHVDATEEAATRRLSLLDFTVGCIGVAGQCMEGDSLPRRLTRVIATIAEGLEILCDDAHVHAAPYGASELAFFRAQLPVWRKLLAQIELPQSSRQPAGAHPRTLVEELLRLGALLRAADSGWADSARDGAAPRGTAATLVASEVLEAVAADAAARAPAGSPLLALAGAAVASTARGGWRRAPRAR